MRPRHELECMTIGGRSKEGQTPCAETPSRRITLSVALRCETHPVGLSGPKLVELGFQRVAALAERGLIVVVGSGRRDPKRRWFTTDVPQDSSGFGGS